MNKKYCICAILVLALSPAVAHAGDGTNKLYREIENTETWQQQIIEARAKLNRSKFESYVSQKILPEMQKGLDLVLTGGAIPTFNPSQYVVSRELGWLVTYRLRDEDVEPGKPLERGDPDITVYIPSKNADYLDVMLHYRSGWTYRLQNTGVVDNEIQAKAMADKYLQSLNMKTEKLRVYASVGLKFQYMPRMNPEPATLQYATRLPEAFEVFVQVKPSDMIIRREYMGIGKGNVPWLR